MCPQLSGGQCVGVGFCGKEILHGMLWTIGSLYGISPCAPLILMLGYAVTMPAYAAALTGTVFALSSAIVPTIFMLVLSGVLSPKIMKEMPEYMDWFRLAVYILLLVIAAAEFL